MEELRLIKKNEKKALPMGKKRYETAIKIFTVQNKLFNSRLRKIFFLFRDFSRFRDSRYFKLC